MIAKKTRHEKALDILLKGGVTPTRSTLYDVKSQSGSGAYTVFAFGVTARCSCPDAQRGNVCKHQLAALGYIKVRDLVTKAMREGRANEVEGAALTASLQADAGLLSKHEGLQAEVILGMFKTLRAEYAAHSKKAAPVCECVAGQWCDVCLAQAEGEQWAA